MKPSRLCVIITTVLVVIPLLLLAAEIVKRNISWTLEGQNDPILQITNEAEKNESAQIRILIGDNVFRYPSDVDIPSGENRFLRIREILEQIGRRYPEIKSETSGILQIEVEGSDREIKTRIVNLNPKGGITSERESEHAAAPLVRTVDPPTGSPAGGTVVTIVGANFEDSTVVKFGGIPALHNRQSDAILIAIAPQHSSGSVDVEASNGKKTSRLKKGFLYEAQAPFIGSLEPESGPAKGGTHVTLKGRNFQPGAVVRWDRSPVLTRYQGPEALLVTTPPGRSGSVSVEVVNPDGKNFVLPGAFLYKGSPQIISVSPEMGSSGGGYTITVNGSNFEPGCSVLFGARYGQTTYINPNALAAVVPAGESGTIDITVSNPAGETDTLGAGFLYNDPPKIISITAVPNPVVRNSTSVITVAASDPEAGSLDYEYRVAQGPAGAVVIAEGDHATYRSPNVVGTTIVQVTVYDEHHAKVQGMLEIKVE